MSTAFPSLEQLAQPQRLDAMDTPPVSIALPAAKPAAQPIKNEVIPSRLSNLEQQGSNISTLGQILAWVAAAKGDFRGLQAIEENKRMTALGKSLHPRMLKINELTASGKWEDAAEETESIVSQYGPVAREMMPYFAQMRDSIRSKQEGWNALKGVVERAEGIIAPDDIRYPALQALQKAVERRDNITATEAFNAGEKLKTDIQIIGGQGFIKTPTSSDIQVRNLPERVKGSDVDNFMGMTLAGQHNLTSSEQLANVLSDVSVQDSSGETITPGSARAMQIKREHSALLPVQAQIDAFSKINLDPATAYQMILELGPMNTLLRNIPGSKGESIKQAVARALGMQEEERLRAGLRTDPFKADMAQRTFVDFDPQSPTYLRELGPMTQQEVQQRGGTVGQPNREVYNREVKPILFHIEALNLIPTMLQGNMPSTRSDQVTGAINDRVSRYLGYPVTGESEIRQNARAIIAKAINAAEALLGTQNINSEEIAQLRQFATSLFTTNEEMLKVVQSVKERLNTAIQRAVGGFMQPGTTAEPALPATVQGKPTVTPQAAPQQQPTRQQRTRSSGKPISTIPPELDRQLQEAEAAARRGEIAPNTTVISPQGTVKQPAAVAQPTIQQKPLTAEERINAAWEKRKQVK